MKSWKPENLLRNYSILYLMVLLHSCRLWRLVCNHFILHNITFLENESLQNTLIPITLLPTKIFNPHIHWDLLPTCMVTLICLRTRHTCHLPFSKHLLATAHTINLWLPFSLNIKGVYQSIACLSLLLYLLGIRTLEIQIPLLETMLWIHQLSLLGLQ